VGASRQNVLHTGYLILTLVHGAQSSRLPNLDTCPPAQGDWKRPDRRRVRAIRDACAPPTASRRTGAPGADHELILTVLSQNTNDRNRDVAYARLTARFESWDNVRDAPVEEVEDAIRPAASRRPRRCGFRRSWRALGDDDLSELETERAGRGRNRSARLPASAARPRRAS